MAQWGVQLLKLIWFKQPENPFGAESLFTSLVGVEPTSFQQNKIFNAAQPFHSLAAVDVDQSHFTLTLMPGRIDLVLIRRDDVPGVPAAWQMGDFLPIAEEVIRRAELPELIGCSRLAVNLHCNLAKESVAASTALVAKAIGLAVDLPSPSDLQMVVNQRMQSRPVPSVSINRLMNLNTTVLQYFSIVSGDGNARMEGIAAPVEQAFANLQIDVNTVPTGGVYDADMQRDLLRELFDEAVRLARAGDVRALL